MPAGSDFTCNNEDCEHSNEGLVVTGAWPLGDISEIIDAPNVSKDKSFQEGMLKLKAEGREYACITYPNIMEIDTVGYRIHMWCPECPCLWTYDVMAEEEDDTIEDMISRANIPKECPKCDTELMDFNALSEDGIKCPYCKKDMEKAQWFSNEVTDEVM